jgi:hypothetical protein
VRKGAVVGILDWAEERRKKIFFKTEKSYYRKDFIQEIQQ